ncbi:TPA: TIGR03750 family conjugal transfer protein [Shewanella algae]|uniref:TIGR03750 family conjugal transfer protein n=1 Tax=Shewanella algae TaxID=38313 RepID=UPI001C59A6F9|nr:TIGR03750 family conjugal transfer protein [Shewanella algae]HDS1208460.1 TIGR03750 family conjugal transfer protein [Shewanella algae]
MVEEEGDFTDSFTADFINDEPYVFKGMTDNELKYIFLLSMLLSLPLGILVALIIGMIELVLVFVVLFPIIIVFFLAGKLRKMRRGKPPGYVEHYYKKRLSSEFISFSGRWGLGRSGKGR